MLIIRESQMRAFRRDRERAFSDALLPYLRQRLPGVAELSGPTAVRKVLEACRRATQYGIDSPEAIVEFTLLSFELGDGFDSYGPVQDLLRGPLSANTAIHLVRDRVQPADVEIIRSSPVFAWVSEETSD